MRSQFDFARVFEREEERVSADFGAGVANCPRPSPFTGKTTDSGSTQLLEVIAAHAVRIGSKGRTRTYCKPIF
jgi:hypothetical protein